jgi:hypothetical protein
VLNTQRRTPKEIGQIYGLSSTQIGQIRRNAQWKAQEIARERGWIENGHNGHESVLPGTS